MPPLWTLILLWLAVVAGLYLVLVRLARQRRVLARLGAPPGAQDDEPAEVRRAAPEDEEPSRLGRWLGRAGFRGPRARTTFLVACALSLLAGILVVLVGRESALLALLRARAALLPPSIASFAGTLLDLAPWFVGGLFAAAPWLYVRAARKRRVETLKRELPILLDLLATLSESGLGFDAAIERVLASSPEGGPLLEELRQFQLETLAGLSRIRCFRHLADRAHIPAMSVFCSAMIQADQVGAGFSHVLRQQADSLRARRREDAMIQAQALPVKLVFPLVICFLPGIFVTTLGPAFQQFAETLESAIGGR